MLISWSQLNAMSPLIEASPACNLFIPALRAHDLRPSQHSASHPLQPISVCLSPEARAGALTGSRNKTKQRLSSTVLSELDTPIFIHKRPGSCPRLPRYEPAGPRSDLCLLTRWFILFPGLVFEQLPEDRIGCSHGVAKWGKSQREEYK